MQDPDDRVLARARAGDVRAFEELVRTCQADVYRFSLYLTHDQELAQDATQDTFLRAFRFFESYRADAKFGSWLLRIARNCSMDVLRKQQRIRREREAGVPEAVPTNAGVARAELDAALRTVSAPHRQVFLLVEIFGLSYREVADVLDLEVGTVKSRMCRARQALCRALVVEEELVR